MTELDLVIRGGAVATSTDVMKADVGVSGERIAALGASLRPGRREIDARGKLVLPGGVDSHCHIEQLSSMGVMCADDFYTATVSAAFATRPPRQTGRAKRAGLIFPTRSTEVTMSASVERTLIAAAVVVGLVWPAAAAAQGTSFPVKPVRLINPFAPGGPVDIVGRTVAQELSAGWGQPVIVDNRPGAGTTLGAALVARATPDGYTLLVTSVSTAVASQIYRNLPFDAARDFAPVAILAQTPLVLAVHPAVPAKSVQEFISLAKAKPGQVSYGSAGQGTITHLAGELLKSLAKVDLVHVPYKGGAPSVAAAAAGEVQAVFDQSVAVMPQARAGKLRAIAVSSGKRAEFAPELPTFVESGVPGFEVIVWNAIFAPGGTPRGIIDRVNADINRVLKQPQVRERLNGLGLEPVGGTAAAFSVYFKNEIARWAKVSKEAGVKIE